MPSQNQKDPFLLCGGFIKIIRNLKLDCKFKTILNPLQVLSWNRVGGTKALEYKVGPNTPS